jgi:hypothetical protein
LKKGWEAALFSTLGGTVKTSELVGDGGFCDAQSTDSAPCLAGNPFVCLNPRYAGGFYVF